MLQREEPALHADALGAVGAWRSVASTDDWHYLVDVVRAIVVGGCGQPERATAELVDAVAALRPASVWSRSDDYQTAFGMLADYRGEPDLADELLSRPLPGIPLLATAVIEHIATKRNRHGEEGWRLTAIELLTPAIPAAGAGASMPELLSWWAPAVAAADGS